MAPSGNAGSRGCPCVVAVNNTRAVAATDDTKGECAYGLECRNLTCIGVADEGFQDAAKLKAAYGAASLLAPSTAMLLVVMLLSVGH